MFATSEQCRCRSIRTQLGSERPVNGSVDGRPRRPRSKPMGRWVNATCLLSGGQHRLQNWPAPASGSPASVLFPPNLHYSSAGTAQPTWAGTGGIKRGRMHAPAATTGCRQPSLFQNIWNMHPLPRNPHVAFHIPNLGVTPQPPLHCLTLLDFLSVLAPGLASGQRNNRRRMN